MKPLSTVIVDDEKYACERLEKLLEAFTEIKLLGSFTCSSRAIEFIIRNKPDLVFLDIEMENNISAFDIINDLRENYCYPHIILITAHQQYSIKAIRNEVFDYLLKPVDIDELKSSIKRLISHISIDSDKIINELTILSKREKEILRYVLNGNNSKEIAERLYISINTVNTHRRNILKKTGCKSTLELLKIKDL